MFFMSIYTKTEDFYYSYKWYSTYLIFKKILCCNNVIEFNAQMVCIEGEDTENSIAL